MNIKMESIKTENFRYFFSDDENSFCSFIEIYENKVNLFSHENTYDYGESCSYFSGIVQSEKIKNNTRLLNLYLNDKTEYKIIKPLLAKNNLYGTLIIFPEIMKSQQTNCLSTDIDTFFTDMNGEFLSDKNYDKNEWLEKEFNGPDGIFNSEIYKKYGFQNGGIKYFTYNNFSYPLTYDKKFMDINKEFQSIQESIDQLFDHIQKNNIVNSVNIKQLFENIEKNNTINSPIMNKEFEKIRMNITQTFENIQKNIIQKFEKSTNNNNSIQEFKSQQFNYPQEFNPQK